MTMEGLVHNNYGQDSKGSIMQNFQMEFISFEAVFETEHGIKELQIF